MLRLAALVGLALVMVIVMIATWGSIGSAALTLGLILGGIFTALKKSLNRESDYEWEE